MPTVPLTPWNTSYTLQWMQFPPELFPVAYIDYFRQKEEFPILENVRVKAPREGFKLPPEALPYEEFFCVSGIDTVFNYLGVPVSRMYAYLTTTHGQPQKDWHIDQPWATDPPDFYLAWTTAPNAYYTLEGFDPKNINLDNMHPGFIREIAPEWLLLHNGYFIHCTEENPTTHTLQVRFTTHEILLPENGLQ